MNHYRQVLQHGLWGNNSALVQLLGLCPLLAVSSNAVHALGLGLATTLVLTLTNILISTLRRWIHAVIRIPTYVIIIASVATVVQLLLQAFSYQLYLALGIFIPLIVTNCIVMGRAEAFAAKQPVLLAALDGVASGLGATGVMLLLGILREIIGTGAIFNGIEQLLGPRFEGWHISLLPIHPPFLLATLPPGAFLVLGLLIALKNYLEQLFVTREKRQKLALSIPIITTHQGTTHQGTTHQEYADGPESKG